MEQLRIDKWLWAARFYKTRSLASEEIGKGRVQVNEQIAKPSREIKVGDTVVMRQGPISRSVIIQGISHQRGPASVAQHLYEETPQSIENRLLATEHARLTREPAQTIENGRPTKRYRREIAKLNQTL